MIRYMLFFIIAMMPLMQAFAVEVAPRISDREIIESLTELKAGQKAINQRIDDLDKKFNGRIDNLDKKFNGRIDNLDKKFNGRIDDLDKKLSGRIDDLHDIMLVILAGIFGLIGFIIWDRRTMIKPLEEKIETQRLVLQHDLELQHPDGSKLTRLLNALRELARKDPEVAAVLKQFTLM